MENEKTEPEKSTEPQTTQAEPAVEPQPEIDIYEQMKTLSEEQKTLCPNKISEFKGESGGNGGGYNNGGYSAPQNNYNNNYSAPPQQAAPQQPAANDSMSYGNLSDFEEILSDGDVPFWVS